MATETSSPPQISPGIVDFYSNRDIFVTGATGFLGKCLIEKFIRSVPDIGRVIILIRPKKGKTVKERLDELLSSKLFDPIRSERPSALDKIVPIFGDCMEPGLGIQEADHQLLTENVSVVFHLAATIKFDGPPRTMLTMNTLAVKDLIKLCRKMKKLISLVHVSTAYAHCNRQDVIEEIIYPPKVQPNNVLALLDWMNDDQLNAITPSLLEGRPNIYTYSKSLAEYILVNEAQDVPFAICRPTIIVGSSREPFPGWVDSLQGYTGMMVATGKGLLRVLRIDPMGIADLVPVDMVNNWLISVGWITAVNPSQKHIVYQYSSGSVNPIRWKDLYLHVLRAYMTNPFDEVFRRPYLFVCRPLSFWTLWHTLLHIIPGFFVDCMRRLQGKQPVIVKLYRRIDKTMHELDFFALRTWMWNTSNTYKLYSLLSPEDQQLFDFDMRKLDWATFAYNFCLGTKKYLFKEDPANIPIARKQLKRLRNIRYTFNFVVFLIATRILYIRSKIARNLWSLFWAVCIKLLTKLGVPLVHRPTLTA